MASDKQNSPVLSSKNKYFSGGSLYEFFKNRPQSVSTPNPSLTVGPVNIDKNRPKNSQITSGVKQSPVVKEKTQPNPDFSKASKIGSEPTMLSTFSVGSLTTPLTAGTIDTSFPNGINTGFDGDVYTTKVQSDGKILIGGDFEYYEYGESNYYAPYFIRLNSDGSPDLNFYYTSNADNNGWNLNGNVRTIDIQSDGKILIGGDFEYYYEDTTWYSPRIMRFNSDGTFDDTFFVGDGFNNIVYKIIVQPDNKILVAGYFTSYNNDDNWRIIRLNSNGVKDNSFNTGDGIDWDDYGIVYDMVLQSDGKIILGGDFYNYDGNNSDHIVRINSNGSYDNTFVVGDGFNDIVRALALQSDGKIIVGGSFNDYNNIDLYDGYIVRLGVNGEMDTRFGYGLNNNVYSLSVQSDDKILVGGYMGTFYIDNNNSISIDELVRFNSDCTFDYSFYYENRLNSGVLTITLDTDNKIYIGGEFYEDGSPYLLNHFGRINNFISEYPYTYIVEDCEEPINGSPIYYTVGSMTEMNTNSTYSFRKLSNPSVTVCGTVNLSVYPSNVIEYEMIEEYVNCEDALFSNAKIAITSDMLDFGEGYNLLVDSKYVVGDILYVDIVFDFIGGPAFVKTVVRINQILPFGSGPYFESATIPYQPYESVTDAIVSNGIHYEVRDTCETDSVSHYPLVHKEWYDNTSILLPSFGTIPCKEVVNPLTFAPYSLISEGTEELFSVVEFTDCDECLTKMGKTGIVDETLFNGGFSGGYNGTKVTTIVEQPDGKLLVGGHFEEYDGTTVNNFMRLNSDGTLDDTFFVGGFDSDGYVKAIALQPDGKILVGGNMTSYDEYNIGRIIRLNSDGSVDRNFTFSTEFNDMVFAIALQADGKILVGGEFTYYYDYFCNHIVRLNTDGSPDTTFNTGDGFNDTVFTISVESTKVPPLYRTGDEAPTYYEDIKVGGLFDEYDNVESRGIARLDRDGNLMDSFGVGFNYGEGGTPRVNQILKQEDGKLVIVGGANDGYSLTNYQGTQIPRNIVRLVEDTSGNYIIDETFDVPPYYYGEGGFNDGYALSVVQQPDGKLIVGGNFDDYEDDNDEYTNLWNIIRLNTDGSYDSTFSMGEGFDGQVIKVLLLNNGKLLTGGQYNVEPTDYLTRLYIGEEYKLRDFTDCNGNEGYTYVPRTFVGAGGGSEFTATTITYSPLSSNGLNSVPLDGDTDDDFYPVDLPLDFSINFLGTTYNTVYVGTNSYLTFGDGSDNNGIEPLPGDIPNETGLPGVYLSTRTDSGKCLDSEIYDLYTGLTDGGDTFIIRFEGNDDYSPDVDPSTNLIYNFKFYKNNPDYFDLIIDSNVFFCNDDPTGGVNNGVDETWVTSFDTSSEKAYRIGIENGTSIKANIDETPKVCGIVGNENNTIVYKGGQGGSMYFNGIDSSVTISYNTQMDLNFGPWTIEWFQYYTSDLNCCLRVFDIGSNTGNEHIGASLEDGNIYVWIEDSYYSYTLNTDIRNTWCNFAISAQNIGGDDWVLRVYQDGLQLGGDQTFNVDLNNFDGPTQLPLTIGGEGNGNSPFEGYITNFRWTKGDCYYQNSTMDVPTSPLVPYNSQLLFLATNEAGLLTNECETYNNPNHIPASEISANNVTWSELNPFGNEVSFYNATGDVTYSSCIECLDTVYYNTSLYVRNPISVIKNEVIPNFVTNRSMTLSDIQKVQTFGPIFTTRGPESYEILNYNL